MKINLTTILTMVVGVLLLLLFVQNSCNREIKPEEPIDIVIPEKEVKPNTPVVIKEVIDTFYIDRIKYIAKESKPDTTLLNKYKKENDSLKKLSMYSDAITKRTYHNTFKDDNVEIDMIAETTGTLDKLSIARYKIKEQVIPYTPPKQSSFAAYVGGEMLIPTTPSATFDAVGKLYVQNKGMMYSVGYSVKGTAIVGLAIKL